MTIISPPALARAVESPAEIFAAAAVLREALAEEITPDEVLGALETWSEALNIRDLDDIAGSVFLRTWLRRGTLEPILSRELGTAGSHGEWDEYGRARLKVFPLGIVGHWPAGNIAIQPMLSMTCALLGGNAAIVRVPRDLREITCRLLEPLGFFDSGAKLMRRIFLAVFDHNRQDLQEAMAKVVDGAMIWGGDESVRRIRALPFPPWARLSVFGPRISAAAMDAGAWDNPAGQESWCRRVARDVWQFEQQACSSPQTLFLENPSERPIQTFIANLRRAFESENRAHARTAIPASMTSRIVQARAAWLVGDPKHSAVFPPTPDWSLLLGAGSDMSQPVQGKTLAVLQVHDLREAISKFDGNVQTLGLGMADADREKQLALLAAKRGVDRIVKLGRMHTFGSPWDGADLIRPMVRLVRHVLSSE